MDVNFTRMNQDQKDTKQPEMHDDLRRLVISMRTILKRKYPVDEERRQVQSRIMREITI